MDPMQTEAKAQALAAAGRILGSKEASGGDAAALKEHDRELLAAYDSGRLVEDLRVFAERYEAMGTDPDDALAEMRRRLQE